MEQEPLSERPAAAPTAIIPSLADGPSSVGRRELASMEAGMLQLKAEACEEVFISQHSLIKMEQDDEDEDEDDDDCVIVGDDDEGHFGRRSNMNDSKESLEEQLLAAAAGSSSMKLYMDLKCDGNQPSSLIEELCLSESSSVCSMMHGVAGGGRVNVNIRAEEVMPAKGEISEQESNADSELLWPSNALEVGCRRACR